MHRAVGHLLLRVDLHRLRRAPVLAKHAHDALGVVDVRQAANDDAPEMPNRTRQVVDEVERADVAFALPRHDCAPARLVAARAERSVIDAEDRLHVVLRVRSFLQRRSIRPHERHTLRRNRAVILEICVRPTVGRRPLLGVNASESLRPEPRCFRRKRDQLG